MNILFLGDSITDCAHNFTPDNLGGGYVKLIASRHPEITAVNGGTNGFTFPRVLQKWQQMYAARTYERAVITCGVNEAGIVMNTGLSQEQSDELLSHSKKAARTLIAGLLENNTSKILLIEPFLFPTAQYLVHWVPVLCRVRKMIRQTVLEFPCDKVEYVPTQNALEQAAAREPITHDGIHLNRFGNQYLAALVEAALF